MPAGGTSEAGSHCPSHCTENTAIPDSSSSSSSGFESVSLLFSSCPHWVWVTSWSIGRPEATERVSVFRPQLASSEQMLQLYRLKRLKGSVLLVGLTRNAQESLANAEDVPASLYRTLAHLLEMSRNGVPYSPIDLEGLQQGMSAAHWARPLWTICEASLPDCRAHTPNSSTGGASDTPAAEDASVQSAGAPKNSSASEGQAQTAVAVTDADSKQKQEEQEVPEGSQAPVIQQQGRVTADEDEEDDGAGSSSSGRSDDAEEADQDLIVRLLKSCPSWCYLYSHEPLKSKKTPPKTSAQMLEMYMSGCLPDWAPLLGLREEVAHFNSLPPSLFTTLAALVGVLKAGLELQPVGLVELQRYDKFIECRNHVGSTMRTPSHDKLVAQASAHTLKTVNSSNPTIALPSSLSTPVDNLSPTLSALAPVSKSSRKPSAGFPAESPTGMASTGGWTPRGNAPSSAAGSEASAGTQAGATTPTAHVVYPTMTPTAWLWGVPQVPFTYLTPSSSPMHGGVTEQQLAGKGTPGKRNASNSPFSVATGSRVSPVPGSARVAAIPKLPVLHQGGFGGSQGGAAAGSMGVHPMMVGSPGSPMHDPAMYAAGGGAAWGWQGYPPMVMPASPMPWTTPLFRLFTADSSRGAGVPAWWYLDRRAVGGRVGPLNCEAMILSYVRGNLADHHFVCGTHGEVTQPPAREFFEELGKLLRQVEEGGEYVLISAAEVMQQGQSGQQHAVGTRGPAVNGSAANKALNQRSRSTTLPAGQPPLPSRPSNGVAAPAGRVAAADGTHDGHEPSFNNTRQRPGSRGNAPPPPPPPGSRVQNNRQPGAASSDSETASHTHPSTDDASLSVTSSSAGGGSADPSNVFATQEAVAAAIAAVAAATSGRKSTDVSAHPAKPLESAAGGPLGSQELSLQQLPELPCSCRTRDQVQKCSKGGACEEVSPAAAGSDDDVAHPAARARTCACGAPRSAPTSEAGGVPATMQAVLV